MTDRMKIARALATRGFKPQIAGDVDFNAAVETLSEAMDSNLGIFVRGECGVGKSLFCRIAADILLANGYPSFMLGTRVGGVNHLGDEAWINLAIKRGALVDDIGSEEMVSERMVRHEYVAEFVCTMHHQFKGDRQMGRIIASTNLKPEELVSRYGDRVLERLREMCVSWEMTGKGKRSFTKVKVDEKNGFHKVVGDRIVKLGSINYAKEVTA